MWFARRNRPDRPNHPDPDPRARAERALLQAFLWMRLYHLAAGVVSLGVDRGRYRRPRLADAAFAAVAAESVWIFVRTRQHKVYDDPLVASVDTLTGCAGLVACALAVRPDDQFNAINWMFPLTLFSAVAGSAGFPRRAQSLSAGAALAANVRPRDRLADRGLAPVGAVRRLAVRGLSHRGRRPAAAHPCERDRDRGSRARRRRAGAERRRGARAVPPPQNLHAGALRTLTEVRDRWLDDRDGARVLARREAIRLRRALQGADLLGTETLARRLDDVSDSLAASGLRVDLVVDQLDPEPRPTVADAVAQAVEAALANVITHAGVTAAVVRVVEVDGRVEVTVRDRGEGAELAGPPSRVLDPIVRVGGVVEVWSAPERGTRVTMRVEP